MSAAFAIVDARAVGVGLEVVGEKLVVTASSPPPRAVLDQLRRHKAEVIQLLRAERRAIVVWTNDHFKSWPFGQCARCGGGSRPNDPFVALFVGYDVADIHTSCHPEWIIERETEARVALGIETSRQRGIEN
jgi:hypothetical protein